MRVLLVEDNEGNRLTLSALLEDEGFAVEVAASFREAAELLRAVGPAYHVVLLDQHLGDGLGTALLPILREQMPAAKAILISGSSIGEEPASDLDARLLKGASFLDLLEMIQRLTGRTRS